MTTRSRAPRWSAAIALTLTASLAATACGSDDDSSSDTTAAEEADVADRPEVVAFCDSTDALIGQIGSLVTAGGDLSTLSGAVDAINSSGAALVSTMPSAGPTVAECMDEVSTALAAAANGEAPDSPSDEPGTTEATDGPGSDGPTTDGPTSDNPDVQAFCGTADALAEELRTVMANPTSGDVAGLTARAQELTTLATQLMTGDPEDAAAVGACLERLTAAVTGSPGGPSTPTTAAPGSDAPADGPSAAAVEEFCATAEELGQQLRDAMADPMNADVAAITAQATELSNQAAGLITANPADAARINECLSALNPG